MNIDSINQLRRVTDSKIFQLNPNLKLTSLEIKYMSKQEVEKRGLKYLDKLDNEIDRWKKDWNTMFKSLEFESSVEDLELFIKELSLKLNQKIIEISKLILVFRNKINGEIFYSENTNFETLFIDLSKTIDDFSFVAKNFYKSYQDSIAENANGSLTEIADTLAEIKNKIPLKYVTNPKKLVARTDFWIWVVVILLVSALIITLASI